MRWIIAICVVFVSNGAQAQFGSFLKKVDRANNTINKTLDTADRLGLTKKQQAGNETANAPAAQAGLSAEQVAELRAAEAERGKQSAAQLQQMQAMIGEMKAQREADRGAVERAAQEAAAKEAQHKAVAAENAARAEDARVRTEAARADNALTRADVVQMVKAKVPTVAIVAAIESRKCAFTVETSALIALKKARVHKSIITAMIKNAVDLKTAPLDLGVRDLDGALDHELEPMEPMDDEFELAEDGTEAVKDDAPAAPAAMADIACSSADDCLARGRAQQKSAHPEIALMFFAKGCTLMSGEACHVLATVADTGLGDIPADAQAAAQLREVSCAMGFEAACSRR